MQIRRNILILAAIAALIASATLCVSGQSHIGPEKGWLVLHGGGVLKDNEVMHRFVALAGGKDAAIVVILTAADQGTFTPPILEQYRAWWKSEYGVSNVEMIDTRDRAVADSEAFVAPIQKATGVWVLGGHLAYVTHAYLGTRTEREIKAVVERGGVVGGASAGAMIQGSFLINVTKTPNGDPLPHSKMYLDAANATGFGILGNMTIYPHFSARYAEKDVAEVVKRYKGLTAIAIDEDTSIILHGDHFEVLGSGGVFVFTPDNRKVSLAKGDKFDLASGKRLSP